MNVDVFTYSESDFCFKLPLERSEPPKFSKFDHELCQKWDDAMGAGVFRYGINHITTKVITGPKQYLAQLNTLRATEKRKHQEIFHLNHPFQTDTFNFTRVRPNEYLFFLHNTDLLAAKSEAILANAELNGSVGPKDDGHDDPGSNATRTSTVKAARHVIMVNVSPVEFGHSLLVPDIDACQPQVLTQEAVKMALHTILLSQHRGLRLGFNSLCALASVNHLHFHLYYLDHPLLADHCEVQHISGRYFEFTGHPCPGFALQLYGSSVEEMARETYRISSYLHENDIAHNVFLTRGSVFGKDHAKETTVRLFIWPRKKFIAYENLSDHEFNVACIELAGHLAVKEEEGFHRLTERRADEVLGQASLSGEEYGQIKQVVADMGCELTTSRTS